MTDLRWGERTHLDVDGVGIGVECCAGPEPPLALLHGFASGTFTWAGVAPLLDHRLVAWDRPPFGRSDRPDPATGENDPYRRERVMREARAVLAEHVATTPVLVGHSAGGLVAAQLVADGLDVAGVVLLAPAIEATPPRPVRALTSVPGSSWLGPAALRVALTVTETALKLAGRHRTPLGDATAAATARSLRRPGTAEALWHLTSTFTGAWTMDEWDGAGPPVLVIGGADDRICPPSETSRVAETLGAELVVLDGVGHAPQEQAPDRVVRLITDFAAALRPR